MKGSSLHCTTLRCASQRERIAHAQGTETEGSIALARQHLWWTSKPLQGSVESDQDTKVVSCYGEHSYKDQRRRAKAVFEFLGKGGYLSPEASELGEHNVLIDCRIDNVPPFEALLVSNDDGTMKSLGEVSPAIRQLKDNFVRQACKIRVFVDVAALTPEYREKEGRAKLGRVCAEVRRKQQQVVS